MPHDKPTRIPIQHMPSGQFGIGDNLGGPDTPDMEPVENAATFYRPVPPSTYSLTRDELRALDKPTVTRRQQVTPADPIVTPADPMLLRVVDTIAECAARHLEAIRAGDLEYGAARLRAAIADGVTAASGELDAEAERLREKLAEALRLAETLVAACEPTTGRPWSWATDKIAELRAGMAVRK